MSLAPPIVFVAYSDESGIGNETEEPIVIVSAIVIHPVSQWSDLHNEIQRLIQEHLPSKAAAGREFHTHDLFGQLSRPNYKNLLVGLLQTLVKFKIPVFYGAVHRKGMRERMHAMGFHWKDRNILRMTQGFAFYMCAHRVETDFHTFAPNERLLWIADHADAAIVMKEFLRFTQKEPLVENMPTTRLDHIIDTLYFGDSKDSRALQLADACNYVIRRFLAGKANAEPYYRIIQPQIRTMGVLFEPRT